MTINWKIFLLACTLHINAWAFAATAEPINIEKVPEWVKPTELKSPTEVPVDDIEGGVYYLLLDNQLRVDAKSELIRFSHHAELVVNQQGLENVSQINVDYDPIYEKLEFHFFRIWRKGLAIDKLSTARMSVIQREAELEESIYDGQYTANVILDDVRVSDIVVYSYTLKGANPVYQGIFSYRRFVEWSVPLHQQSLRILWGKKNLLAIKKLNTDIPVLEARLGDYTEYSFTTMDSVPRRINSQIPKWYDPYGVIYFSESKNWSDVVSWALSLYQNAITADKEVVKIAESIAEEHKDPAMQIAKALQFVQKEIRYFGIEMGVNSHKPSSALQVLTRRYGDCKDKAVLFISLLRQLGIKASSALVNTSATRQLENYPRLINAFNHVLVKVTFNDEIYWLDPTRQYQAGNLGDIYQPDYHLALTVEEGVNKLERMQLLPGYSQLVINDQFDLSK